MAKFGLFTMDKGPYQTYEGGYMTMDKEFVHIYQNTSEIGSSELVAAVRLDKTQCVKKIE